MSFRELLAIFVISRFIASLNYRKMLAFYSKSRFLLFFQKSSEWFHSNVNNHCLDNPSTTFLAGPYQPVKSGMTFQPHSNVNSSQSQISSTVVTKVVFYFAKTSHFLPEFLSENFCKGFV